jgi:hypothetical protein
MAAGGWAGPPAGGSYYPPPGPPRRARPIVVVFVVILVIILVLAVVSLTFAPGNSGIQVTGINFDSPDNACGLDGATDYGFNASTSQAIEFSYAISGNNTTSGGTAACAINSINTTTPGFSVTGANVPLQIPANSSPTLSFQLNTPGSPYTGVLTFVLT